MPVPHSQTDNVEYSWNFYVAPPAETTMDGAEYHCFWDSILKQNIQRPWRSNNPLPTPPIHSHWSIMPDNHLLSASCRVQCEVLKHATNNSPQTNISANIWTKLSGFFVLPSLTQCALFLWCLIPNGQCWFCNCENVTCLCQLSAAMFSSSLLDLLTFLSGLCYEC